MQTAIMITFNGDIFLFDNDLTEKEYLALQDLADSQTFRDSINPKDKMSIRSSFIDIVMEKLGISLQPVKISYVIRIK